ncbi:MAG: ferredoxin:quinone oxidoreductase [Pyrobaculum sp.]
MIELALIVALAGGGLAVVATANSLVRVVIGSELLVLAAIFAAASIRDINMLAVATGVGVAETLLLVAALFKMARGGYV